MSTITASCSCPPPTGGSVNVHDLIVANGGTLGLTIDPEQHLLGHARGSRRHRRLHQSHRHAFQRHHRPSAGQLHFLRHDGGVDRCSDASGGYPDQFADRDHRHDPGAAECQPVAEHSVPVRIANRYRRQQRRRARSLVLQCGAHRPASHLAAALDRRDQCRRHAGPQSDRRFQGGVSLRRRGAGQRSATGRGDRHQHDGLQHQWHPIERHQRRRQPAEGAADLLAIRPPMFRAARARSRS